jgi:endonuclease III
MKITPKNKQRIVQLFERLQQQNPVPKTELNYSNPFTLLVAVVLSAQSTDVGVNKVTEKLFKIANTPQKMKKLGEAKIREHIKTLNFFNNKAKHVYALCGDLIDKFGGQVPNTREALQTLAGVGRKTANVVLNVVFGEPTMAVDTHIFRVSQRLGLAKGKTPDEIEQQLLKTIPSQFLDHAHHWLILHGRYVCKARAPVCSGCLLQDLCVWPERMSEKTK